MKLFTLLLSALLLAPVFVSAQGVGVNPFEDNRNEFNQKDFISLIDDHNVAVRQQIYGYDWVEALNQNSYANIVELSDFAYSDDGADGFIAIETANFNGDDKDDIFYLVEKDDMWTYGATYQGVDLGAEDSLYHFLNPATPAFVNGAMTGSDYSYPCIVVGDFNGDDLDEIAVAWAMDNEVHLQIVTVTDSDGELVVTPMAAYTDNEVSVEVNGQYAISLSAADLNNDGTDELFVGSVEESSNPDVEYNAFVKVYDVGTGQNFDITPKGRAVYEDQHLGEDEDINDGGLSAARTAVQGVRAYPSTEDEGVESIFAAVVLDRFNEFSSFDYLYTFHLTASADLNTLTISNGPVLTNNEGSTYDYGFPCEAHKGDINGDAQDDIVLLTSSYTIFSFEEGEMYLANNEGHGPNMDMDPIEESNDLFDVGDVNRDGLEDIISQTKTYSTAPFGHHYWLQAYASDADFNLDNAGSNEFIVESGMTYTNYGFDIGNLDGNDLCLGDPVTLDCDYYKPIIILETIPNHFDIVDGTQYDINNCYEFGNPGACANNVSFVNTEETVESQSVQVSRDWSVSSTLNAGIEYAGFAMGSSLGYKYGEQFSNTQSSSESIIITTTSNAIRDDFLRVQRFPFVMQEFPVLGPTGDTLTYIVAAFPNPDEDIAPDDDNSRSLYNYIPNHEVGNILSYPRPDDEDLFYDKSEQPDWLIHEFGSQDINTGVTEEITLGTAASDALSQSSTTTETLSSSVGASGFGLGASVEGEYTESEMNVFGQTLSSAEAYTISPGQVIGGTDTWEYDIYPVLYWTRDNAAKLAMGVDLSDAGANWQSVYGQSPDPALNLPYRLEYAYNDDYQEDLLDRTKSVYFNKFNPNPGDTVTAFVRVFNYSLMSMSEPVSFSMYNGHPNDGGTLIANLDGSTLFSTGENLENQGRTIVEVPFVVTNEMIGGEFNKIYVELDPNDEISEIHEENNLGWVNLGLACNTPDGVVGIGDIELEGDEITVNVFPNPGSDLVNIDFQSSLEYLNKNLRLRLSDISGKVLVEKRVQSNGSGMYRFDVSNLPGGMYIYQLVSEDKAVYSGKLIVR